MNSRGMFKPEMALCLTNNNECPRHFFGCFGEVNSFFAGLYA